MNFDIFTPGTRCQIVDINGVTVGVNICEDIWVNPGPGDHQCVAGAESDSDYQCIAL